MHYYYNQSVKRFRVETTNRFNRVVASVLNSGIYLMWERRRAYSKHVPDFGQVVIFSERLVANATEKLFCNDVKHIMFGCGVSA